MTLTLSSGASAMLPSPDRWLDLPALAREIGERTVAEAAMRSPVRTGAMRDGWGFTTSADGATVTLTNHENYAEFYPQVAVAAVAAVDTQGMVDRHIKKRVP